MPRRPLTWLIAGGLLIVAVAGLIDALRGSSSAREPPLRNLAPSPAPAAASHEPLPTCARPELELGIEILGGSATTVLRHVSGGPCHLKRVPVRVTVRDRAGRRVQLVAGEGLRGAFRGDFSAGFEQLINITFLPHCTPETVPLGPFLLSARAGPYRAQRALSGQEIGCFGGG